MTSHRINTGTYFESLFDEFIMMDHLPYYKIKDPFAFYI